VNKTVTDFVGIYTDTPPPQPPSLRLCYRSSKFHSVAVQNPKSKQSQV